MSKRKNHTRDLKRDVLFGFVKMRVSGGVRICLLGPEIENRIARTIKQERLEGNRVVGTDVRRWAKELAAKIEIHIEDFQSSSGWLTNILRRHEFS